MSLGKFVYHSLNPAVWFSSIRSVMSAPFISETVPVTLITKYPLDGAFRVIPLAASFNCRLTRLMTLMPLPPVIVMAELGLEIVV